MSLSIDVWSRATGEAIAVLRGELSAATSPRLIGVADEVLRGRPAGLSLDLSLVTYADAAGVAALLQVQRNCSGVACRLVVDRISPVLERALSTVGVSDSMLPRAR